MDERAGIACIEFSEEAKLTVGVALQQIANTTPRNLKTNSEDIDASSRPKRFTTITDLTEDRLIVNEIDEELVNNITELIVTPISKSVIPKSLPKNTISNSINHVKKVSDKKDQQDSSTTSISSSKRSRSKKKRILNRKQVPMSIRCICPECNMEFEDFSTWKTHVVHTHDLKQMPINCTLKGTKDYFCNKCHGIIRVGSSLKMLYHQISHSPKPSCFECRLCNWRHSAYTRLFKHVCSYHFK